MAAPHELFDLTGSQTDIRRFGSTVRVSDVTDLPSTAMGPGSSDGQFVYFPRSLSRHTTAFSVCPQFS